METIVREKISQKNTIFPANINCPLIIQWINRYRGEFLKLNWTLDKLNDSNRCRKKNKTAAAQIFSAHNSGQKWIQLTTWLSSANILVSKNKTKKKIFFKCKNQYLTPYIKRT